MRVELKGEVIIVGAGPSGIRTAWSALEKGFKTIVFEWDESFGGIKKLLGHSVKYPEEAKLFNKTTVVRLQYNPKGKHRLIALARGKVYEVEGERVVVATGSRDLTPAAVKIAGDRPSGIFTATEALRLINGGYVIGNDVIVYGSNEMAISLSVLLASKGYAVRLVAPEGFHSTLKNVEVLSGLITTVLGKRRVRGVVVKGLNEGNEVEEPCDTLIISRGYKPMIKLIEGLKVNIDWRTGSALVNENFEALKGIYLVGGSLAPFELMENVEKSGNLEFDTSLNHGIDIVAGKGLRFVVPQMLGSPKEFTLFYSLLKQPSRLFIPEENIEIDVSKREGYLSVRPSNNKKRLTVEAYE
ncbi:MAG: NAD(P)/FAD-dependent oxidoreductase [Caldisphaeraceae archaeon]|nr:NAD(P)/FAD-dependent oxidoreductase [Caldisphaeraceae archaeon]